MMIWPYLRMEGPNPAEGQVCDLQQVGACAPQPPTGPHPVEARVQLPKISKTLVKLSKEKL